MTKKRMIIISVLVIVFWVGASLFVYIKDKGEAKDNVFDFFFKDESEDFRKLMKKYDQSVTIDDYTITLDSAIFDDKTETIYSMFRVSKGNEKVEATIYGGDGLDYFGENNRFFFRLFADIGGADGFTAKYDGKDLIIYGSFVYHCDITEDEQVIYLFDGTTRKIDYENCAAKFYLDPTVDSVKFDLNDEKELYISPLAIKIESKWFIGTETIEIGYSDGTTQEVINVEERIGIGGSSVSKTDSEHTEQYIMKDLIDIDKIEYILYNGKKYTR